MELEGSADLRQVLRDVFFLGAKEVDAAGKKAICVYVPVPQQQQFQKIQVCSLSLSSFSPLSLPLRYNIAVEAL